MGWFSRRIPHTRRRPREGYIRRMIHQLRRFFRGLLYYMRKHPTKIFVLVILPLITGGALQSVLRKFGIRLPGGSKGLGGGHSSRGGLGGLGGLSSIAGGGGIGSLLRMVQSFI
ncbi:MAG: hypothetical protein M1813_006537 [Trichoglossum hirsutum]|nr:MAG: hypothetical protein M1813_006537 [Trichoglossum hirsutum]